MERRPHLTPTERTTLLAVVASHPNASTAGIALIFRARTGRPISYVTAYRARHWGYHERVLHPRLTPDQREILSRLVRESAPDYSRSEVAAAFSAAAGRTISLSSVSEFMLKSGLPKIPRGRGDNRGLSPEAERSLIAARIAAAEARRRARVPDQRRIPGRSCP